MQRILRHDRPTKRDRLNVGGSILTTGKNGRQAVSELLRGISLYLIGMMGAGKSTVGRCVAQRLGYRFMDTDTVIEQVTQQSVADLFANQGEAAFRQVETQVLAELSTYTRLTIATGGGIVLRRENWGYLRHGVIVWLDVGLNQLQERLHQDTSRPLLQVGSLEDQLRTLWQQRQALYAQADLRVTSQPGETPEQVADRILTDLPQVILPPPTISESASLN